MKIHLPIYCIQQLIKWMKKAEIFVRIKFLNFAISKLSYTLSIFTIPIPQCQQIYAPATIDGPSLAFTMLYSTQLSSLTNNKSSIQYPEYFISMATQQSPAYNGGRRPHIDPHTQFPCMAVYAHTANANQCIVLNWINLSSLMTVARNHYH